MTSDAHDNQAAMMALCCLRADINVRPVLSSVQKMVVTALKRSMGDGKRGKWDSTAGLGEWSGT